jgi:hypothetical protein
VCVRNNESRNGRITQKKNFVVVLCHNNGTQIYKLTVIFIRVLTN